MKLLLTSAGISNNSIRHALVQLLGKPVEEATALFVPTAIHPLRYGTALAGGVIRGTIGDPFCELGWKSLGVLELTALPTIAQQEWLPQLQAYDALLVGGGDCQYLTYWMQQSGLAALLPDLCKRVVYVGLSAGSMVMTAYGTTFSGHRLPADTHKSLGFVNIAIHPHLDHDHFPENAMAKLVAKAATLPIDSYLIDDQTALLVSGGVVEIVSEGKWKLVRRSV